MFRQTLLSAGVVSLLLMGSISLAQPAGAGKGSAGVGFQGKHTLEQLAALRGHIAVSDAEWQALSPKIEKVLVAKQNLNTGAGMTFQSSNNAKPVFEASRSKPDNAAGRALQGVREALVDEAAPADELKKKMDAVRQARQKARAEHEAAMVELVDALTPRQQAILMTFGVVE